MSSPHHAADGSGSAATGAAAAGARGRRGSVGGSRPVQGSRRGRRNSVTLRARDGSTIEMVDNPIAFNMVGNASVSEQAGIELAEAMRRRTTVDGSINRASNGGTSMRVR